MVLEHVINDCDLETKFQIISTEPTIGALHGQQSAVLCLSSKRERDFLRNSLVFGLLRAFSDSVHLIGYLDLDIS